MKKRYLITFFIILFYTKIGYSAELFTPETIPLLAVLEFRAFDIEQSFGKDIQDAIGEHVAATQKYRIEKDQLLIKTIKEMQIKNDDLVNTEKLVQLGKKLEAKGIIIGIISFSNNKYHIKAQLIDVKVGDIIKTEEISFSKKEHISLAAKIISYKLINLEINETIPSDEVSAPEISEIKFDAFNINLTFFENAIVYLGVQYRFFWLVAASLRFGYAVHKNEDGYYLSGMPIVLDVNFYPFKSLKNFQPYASLGLIYLIGTSMVNSKIGFLSQLGLDVKIIDKLFIFGDAGIIISNKKVILNLGFGAKYYFF